MDWYVGQEVIIKQNSRYGVADQPATVTKIARKYLTVEYPWGSPHTHTTEAQFEIATGHEKNNGYTWTCRVMTPEMLEAEERRAVLLGRLRDLGLTGAAKLSTAQLEAVVAALESTP